MRYSSIVPAILLALVTPALSQVDPEPDGIGIYADLEATQVNVTATQNDIIPVYLLLTRPTTLTGVSTWACTVVVPSNAQILGWFVPGWSMNVASPPDFVVARGQDPHPVADIIHLMTFYIRMSDTEAGHFYLTGSALAGANYDDFPVYLEVGDYNTAHYLHCYPNGEDLPVFAVNAEALATESASWGDVKALFR
jgi:hypothetical protein